MQIAWILVLEIHSGQSKRNKFCWRNTGCSHWSGIKKFLAGRTTSKIKNYVTMLLKKNERGLSHEFKNSDSRIILNNIVEDNSNSNSDIDDSNFPIERDCQKKV